MTDSDLWIEPPIAAWGRKFAELVVDPKERLDVLGVAAPSTAGGPLPARGITHVRLGPDGQIAAVLWGEVTAATSPAGPFRKATVEQLAAAIDAGETVAFWTLTTDGRRSFGGVIHVERGEGGRLHLVEVGAGDLVLLNLPRF
ncbi:hypothetical protein [Aquabacterium humicola]|uniref:hypothetical protein n=1 Tax=Aquabacterium humicola TaxID=3237377 RepID=UPI0025432836|nr:hypothetical protein [Rubrivivax pictus]